MTTVGEPLYLGARVIGRPHARQVIADFLDRARRRPTTLVLEGEPGIGKTSLWQDALEGGKGMTVLVCQPTAAEQSLPFAGLGDLLGSVADEVLPDLPDAQRVALEVALCRTPPGPGGVHALAASHGLLSALRLLARQRPVLVAVDDLQWLDPATAQALTFALRRIGEPASLLATCRVGAPPTSLDDLPRETLQVGALDLDETEELLHSRLGERFRLPALLEIHRRSGGNPLHAVEVARAALSSGVELHPGRQLPVPPDLASLLRRRVAQLPPGSERTLTLVAALAQPTVEVLAAAVGSREAVTAHLGRPAGAVPGGVTSPRRPGAIARRRPSRIAWSRKPSHQGPDRPRRPGATRAPGSDGRPRTGFLVGLSALSPGSCPRSASSDPGRPR